jgi:hypothetical protein
MAFHRAAPPQGYLKRLRELCTHGIPLIRRAISVSGRLGFATAERHGVVRRT